MGKTAKSRSDTAVQGTNDSSIVSKCSAASRGYFKDTFLPHLVAKQCRRSPLINRSYYSRFKAMEFVMSHFLKHFAGQAKQILSLGCGFDSCYFRLKDAGELEEHDLYIEVDFGDVMMRKLSLIRQSSDLRHCLWGQSDDLPLLESVADGMVLDTPQYKMLAADLTQIDDLSPVLAAAGIETSLPTLLVSEVVLCYLPSDSASDVIRWCAATFPHSAFLAYEQILPKDAFGIVMCGHFKKIGSPLRSIESFPTPATQVERYRRLGWPLVVACDLNRLHHRVTSAADRRRVSLLEPFDEFEEWHQNHAHYMVLTALQGRCQPLEVALWPPGQPASDVGLHGATADTPREQAPGILVRSSCHGNERLSTTQNQLLGSREAEPLPSPWRLKCRPVSAMGQGGVAGGICLRYAHAACVVHPAGTPTGTHAGSVLLACGGFGEAGGRHGRVRTLAAVSVSRGVPVAVHERGAPGVGLERMHHTATADARGTRVVILGGRCSPANPWDCGTVHVLECGGSQAGGCQPGTNRPGNRAETDTHITPEATPGGRGTCRLDDETVGVTMAPPTGNSDAVEVEVKVVRAEGPAPAARWRHTASLDVHNGVEALYMFGGRSTESAALGDVHRLRLDAWSWTKIDCGGLVPCPRHSHSAAVWKRQLVVSGGLSGEDKPLGDVISLDLDSMLWAPLTLCGELSPRYSHSSALVDDTLFLIGGVCLGSTNPGVAVIDLANNTVVTCPLPMADPERPLMLYNNSIHVVGGSRDPCGVTLLCIGGGGNCFSFGTHLNESPWELSITRII